MSRLVRSLPLYICLCKVKEIKPLAPSAVPQACAVTLAIIVWAVPVHEALVKCAHVVSVFTLQVHKATARGRSDDPDQEDI